MYFVFARGGERISFGDPGISLKKIGRIKDDYCLDRKYGRLRYSGRPGPWARHKKEKDRIKIKNLFTYP